MAITWRNVEGPNFRDAILAGTTAQQQMNAGFDNFNKILEQETKTNLANWDNTKVNNTRAAMNELMQYRTPEEYQAAQASGALNALTQRYGAQVDQEAIRTAIDNRLPTLQQRALTGIDFKNKTLEDQLRPIAQQAEIFAAKGDTASLDALYANNPTLRDFMGGKLSAKAIEGARAADLHKYAGNKDVRDGQQLESTIQHQRATEDIGRTQARASLLSAQAQNYAIRNKGNGGKLYSAAEQHAIDASPYGGGRLDAKGGIEQVAQDLKKAGWDSDKVASAMAGLLKEFPDGKILLEDGKSSIGVPVSTITSYMLKNGDNWFFNEGSSAASQFKTMMRKDKAFVNTLLQVDEIINGNATRAIADKADPAAAKERARAQGAEALRAQANTVTNPLHTSIADFPKPTEQSNPGTLYFNPITRAGVQVPEGNVSRADVLLRKRLQESKNPVNGLNLVK